jgi:hypothetical protein
LDCHAPLSQGPCIDSEWWVQKKPGLACSSKEECTLNIPVKYLQGLGECAFRHCELPDVYYNGKCQNAQVNVCKEKGKHLVVNLKGDAVCQCGQGWGQDENGNCALLYSEGSCGSGNLFIRRDQALTRSDLDVPCRQDLPCKQECKSMKYFIETLEEEYGCFDYSCKVANKRGFCCPLLPAMDDTILWYIDRLHYAEYTRGICVRNPCPPGEVLHHNITQSEEYTEDQDTNIYCTPANDEVLTCEGEIKLDGDGRLKCCPNSCLQSSGYDLRISTTNVRSCRRRYFYHPQRERCVRGYG